MCLCPDATVMVAPLLMVNGPTEKPFVPVSIVTLDETVELLVNTPLPPAIDLSAGNVTNTSFVPAEKLTADPELLDAKTVVLASVVPDDVYVPIPTSHSEPPCKAIA